MSLDVFFFHVPRTNKKKSNNLLCATRASKDFHQIIPRKPWLRLSSIYIRSVTQLDFVRAIYMYSLLLDLRELVTR